MCINVPVTYNFSETTLQKLIDLISYMSPLHPGLNRIIGIFLQLHI